MTPDTTNSERTARAPQPSGLTLAVPKPDAGAEISVPSSPGGVLEFEFDPSQATVTREDYNLVFEVDGGGKVVVQDYFIVGDESLPDLKIPALEGESEATLIASTDFFAGSDLDMSTAAGETSAPPSGGSDGSGQDLSMTTGINALGTQGTWNWTSGQGAPADDEQVILPVLSMNISEGYVQTYSLNESQTDGTSLEFSFDRPLTEAVTLRVSVTGNAQSVNMLGDAEEFRSDFLLDLQNATGCTVVMAPNGDLLITFPVGATSASLPIKLIDDHIDDGPKDIIFSIVQVEAGNIVANTGAFAKVIISEDAQHHNVDNPHGAGETFIYDGPVVSFDRVTSDASKQEGNPDGSNPERLNFVLQFTDPHTGDSYSGYNGDNLLSQDMTLTFKVFPSGGHGAVYGDDYVIDLSEIQSMQGVESATYENGVLTIKLYGRVDENGEPHSNPPFDFTNGGGLSIPIVIINDTITERHDETFTVELVGASGNESTGSDSITGTIEKDASDLFNGPFLSLTGPGEIAESNAAFEKYAPEHNAAEYVIKLTESANSTTPKAAAEGITIAVTIAPLNDESHMGGDESDFNFSGAFKAFDANGVEVDIPAGNISYVGNGVWNVTIPAGASELRFSTHIEDDARENESSAGQNEGYNVSFDLVYTDAAGNPYTGPAGAQGPEYMADGEARLGSQTSVETIIIEDTRGGAQNLNPDNFDGPFVGISRTGTLGAIQESSGNSFEFKVDLTVPDGGSASYAADEPIDVTLKLAGNVSINDFFIPLGNKLCDAAYKSTHYDANDNPVISYTYQLNGVTFTGTASVNSTTLEFTVTIPKGATGLVFAVPVNDDPLGGANHQNSGMESANESFTVTITGLTGNEARADGATGRPISVTDNTITDDSLSNGYEGMQVGLAWGAGSGYAQTANHDGGAEGPGKRVEEGLQYKVDIKLYDEKGAALTAANNPYAGYTSGGKLPEDMVLTLNLDAGTSTTATGDIAYSLGGLATLLGAGKITITIDGVTYGKAGMPGVTPYTTMAQDALEGEIKITLIGGQFNPATDQASLNFGVSVTPDNVHEWDHRAEYAEQATENIQISLGVSGHNESKVISGGGNLGAVISDRADGVASLSHEERADSSGWEFTVNVTYSDGENVAIPGEPVHLRIQVGDSDVMQRGEEFDVDAFSLFASINAKEGNPLLYKGVALTADNYKEWLEDLRAEYDGDLLKASQDSGLVLVKEFGDYAKGGDSYFDIYAPTNAFADGHIDFGIDKGTSSGMNSGNGFTVNLVDPYYDPKADPNSPSYDPDYDSDGKPEFDMKGEIVTVNNDEAGAVDQKGETLEVRLVSTKGTAQSYTVQEDPNDPKDGFDTYKVDFTSVRTVTNEDGTVTTEKDTTDRAAANLTFTMVLFSKRATLDENTTDNHLHKQMDDYAFCDKDGTPLVYNGVGGSPALYTQDAAGKFSYEDGYDATTASTPTMLQALNADLAERYGLGEDGKPNVQITGVSKAGSSYNFEFTVREGTDLSDGIQLSFKALDDYRSDSGEGFGMKIGDFNSYVEGSDVENPVNVKLEDNRQETVIRDETGGGQGAKNGFALGLEPGFGREAGNVLVPVRAYVLGPDGEIMSLADLRALHAGEGGGMSFEDFLSTYFSPAENISFAISANGGSAEHLKDYVDPSGKLITIGSNSWDGPFIDEATGTVYFRSPDKVSIQSIEDYLHEGDETFNVGIVTPSGNESRPLKDTETEYLNDNKDEQDVTIGQSNTATIEDVLNGPVLVGFGPKGGVVHEPIDFQHDANDYAGTDPSKATEFVVKLSDAVAEPVAVWFGVQQDSASDSKGGFAEYGEDFVFGDGMFFLQGGTVWECKTGSDPVDTGKSFADFWVDSTDDTELPHYIKLPAGDGPHYFAIINDDAAVRFDVIVKDDNRDEEGEHIGLTIKDMQGSEVQYPVLNNSGQPTGETKPWAEKETDPNHAGWKEEGYPSTGLITIMDDGFGPEVSMKLTPGGPETLDVQVGEDLNFTVQLSGKCDEDVAVDIIICDKKMNPIGTVTVVIPAGQLSADGTIPADMMPDVFVDSDGSKTLDFFIKMGESLGGESNSSGEPVFVHHFSPNGSHPWLNVGSFTSDKISEDGASYPATPTYTLGMTVEGGNNGHWTDTTPDHIEITLDFMPGSAGPADVGQVGSIGSVTVHIDKEDLLETLADQGIDGDFDIIINPDGTISVSRPGEPGSAVTLPSDKSYVEGDMPTAVADNAIEGDENFWAIISDTNIPEVTDAVAETVIVDETKAGVLLLVETADGSLVPLHLFTDAVPEGTELKVVAKLVQVDANGNPVDSNGHPIDLTDSDFAGQLVEVTTNIPLEYTVGYADGTADSSDYTGDKIIRFEPGQSNAAISVTINQDDNSEPDENFTLKAELSEESKKLLAHEGIDMPHGGIAGSAGAGSITITDDDSGPMIKWTLQSDANEAGAATIQLESYLRDADGNTTGTRVVVSEDVKLTFELESSSGFNLDDIQSITIPVEVNGKVTLVTYEKADFDQVFSNSGSGTGPWQFTVVLEGGRALTGANDIKIKYYNDTIAENSEKFSVKVVGIEGGEADYQKGEQEVTLKEHINGPVVNITAGTGSEADDVLTASIKLTFTGGQPTEESSFITLELTDSALEQCNFTFAGGSQLPDNIAFSIPGVTILGFDPDTGELKLKLPSGMGKNEMKELEVFFPIKDNSLAGEQGFTVKLTSVKDSDNVARGELTIGGAPTYSWAWKGERSGNGDDDSGSNTVVVTRNPGGANVTGSAEFEVSLLNEISDNIIKTVIVDGKELPFLTEEDLLDDSDAAGWTWNGKSVVVHGQSLGGHTIEVVYDKDANPALVSQAKLNAGGGDVNTSVTPGVTTNIKSEEAESEKDGPQVHLDVDPSVTEGGILEGSVVITMPGLDGDDYSQGTAEDLLVTLTVDRMGGKLGAFTVAEPARILGPADDGYDSSLPEGTYQIFIPKGTPITGGEITITFTQQVPDDSLALNSDVTVTIDNFTGLGEGNDPRYETHRITGGSSSTTVNNDATASGPEASLVLPEDVNEGQALQGSVVITMPGTEGDNYTNGTVEDLLVVLEVGRASGALGQFAVTPPAYVLSFGQPGYNEALGDGFYQIIIPKGTEIKNGEVSISFTQPVPNDSNPENSGITVKIDSFAGLGDNGQGYEAHTINDTQKENTVTVNDGEPDGFTLALSGEQQGMNFVYTITVSQVGALETLENATASFTMDMTQFSNIQWAVISEEFISQGAGISATDNVATITLPEGFDYARGGILSFAVPLEEALGKTVTLGNLDGSSVEYAHIADGAGSLATPLELDFSPSLAPITFTAPDLVDVVTIHGSDLGDAISAGSGGSVIYGGGGDDTLFAGAGDDVFIGGGGSDIFVWNSANFGGNDTIKGFDFNASWERNEESGRYELQTGTGYADRIGFADIFGESSEGLDGLLGSLTVGEVENSFTARLDGSSLTALFAENELTLTLEHNGVNQQIVVQSENPFHTTGVDINAETAQMILRHILSDYGG